MLERRGLLRRHDIGIAAVLHCLVLNAGSWRFIRAVPILLGVALLVGLSHGGWALERRALEGLLDALLLENIDLAGDRGEHDGDQQPFPRKAPPTYRLRVGELELLEPVVTGHGSEPYPGQVHSAGLRASYGRAASICAAMQGRVASSRSRPMNRTPIGRPSVDQPIGIVNFCGKSMLPPRS